jgi:putative membrane protein
VHLTESEKQAIESRVAALEAASGVEIVTIIVGKADVYPEIVWKAFALGASLAGLGVSVCEFLSPTWTVAGAALVDALAILGAGAVSAVLAIYVPAFARLFLRRTRAELEVEQYARIQFLDREMFATPDRTAILLLTSLLEHEIVLLPDRGIAARVSAAAWDVVIARMAPLLRSRQTAAAVLAGLDVIGEILAGKGFCRGESSPGGNRFPDPPVEVRAP